MLKITLVNLQSVQFQNTKKAIEALGLIQNAQNC